MLAHQRVLNSSSKKSVCSNITVSADECVILSQKEKIDNLTFPLHVVSGAPGSGNDWVLWLASITSKCHYLKSLILCYDKDLSKVQRNHYLYLLFGFFNSSAAPLEQVAK